MRNINISDHFTFTVEDTYPNEVLLRYENKSFRLGTDVFKYVPPKTNLNELDEETSLRLLEKLQEFSAFLSEEEKGMSKNISNMDWLKKTSQTPSFVKTSEPTHEALQFVTVTFFEPKSRFTIEAYYHDIIYESNYIVLVWSTKAQGIPKFVPNCGTEFYVRTPNLKEPVLVFSYGYLFRHGDFEYYLLVIREKDEIEEKEENHGEDER